MPDATHDDNRIPFAELQSRIERILLALGLAPARAALSARLTAETDRDGVRTHGIARLPRFADWVRAGRLDPTAEPSLVQSVGGLERWTGHRGPGNLAAHTCMERACALAHEHGLGLVALADTSHWMRAGTYGYQAAEAGLAAMCWSNTFPNLPPWGATTPAIGNNPLVIAIPNQPAPIVLDMAMSQFSYGTLHSYAQQGRQLPVPGGYDESGALTTDPTAIDRTQRALPVGYWKGSGLSFVLDVLAAMLTGGLASHQIPADPAREVGQSQVFLAIDPTALSPTGTYATGANITAELSAIAHGAIDFLHAATPIDPASPPRYPGEATLRTRAHSLTHGVLVEPATWAAFQQLESTCA